MKVSHLVLALVFLLIAIGLSLYFNEVLIIFATSLKLGWVFSSFLIRFLVLLFFTFFLYYCFALFPKTRKIRYLIVFLIGMVPGFFLSFAFAPIYATDYGIFNDNFKIKRQTELTKATNNEYVPSDQYSIVAFFTTNCPFCMSACRKLSMNEAAGQTISVNLFFPGNKEDTNGFLTENNGLNFNHFLINDESLFMDISGASFPSIFLLDEKGETIYHWIGDQMNYSALDYLADLEQ